MAGTTPMSGSATEQFQGKCSALYRPGLRPEKSNSRESALHFAVRDCDGKTAIPGKVPRTLLSGIAAKEEQPADRGQTPPSSTKERFAWRAALCDFVVPIQKAEASRLSRGRFPPWLDRPRRSLRPRHQASKPAETGRVRLRPSRRNRRLRHALTQRPVAPTLARKSSLSIGSLVPRVLQPRISSPLHAAHRTDATIVTARAARVQSRPSSLREQT